MNDHRVRNRINAESKIHPRVRASLQTCKLTENEGVLERALNSIKDEVRKNHLKALLYILRTLLATVPQLNGRLYTQSYIEFGAAFDIFLSFSEHGVSSEKFDIARKMKNMQKEFRNLLLHPHFGLCVYILKNKTQRFVVLRPDEVDYGSVLACVTASCEEIPLVEKKLVSDLLLSMDTEWDKNIMRYLLSKLYSYKEYESLGMDCHSIKKNKIRIEGFITDMENIEVMASNNVKENLKRRLDEMKSRISRDQKILFEKSNKWTKQQKDEREELVTDLESKKEELHQLIQNIEVGQGGPTFLRRLKYEKEKLVRLNRLKLRKRGSGRKQIIDEEDEKFVAKSIEDKATAHGRRHDSTLYLGHRVKKKDLLKLINYYHAERGLPSVKSVTTVYNRGRAKCKKSLQAKRHLGMGLWCTKKPPKTDSCGNILTHYCRATKKNIIRKLFQHYPEEVLCRSYDDKATVCPATGTGMNSARKQAVLMPSDPEKQRKLPMYDWPTTMVNVTPGPVLYMTKAIENDADGKEKIVTSSEDVICHIKPKFFVGSDVASWSSLLMENRHSDVILHEVRDSDEYSLQSRNFIVRIMDTLRSFTLQTKEEDVLLIDKSQGPNFLEYEQKKLLFLKRNCECLPADVMEELGNETVLSLLHEIVETVDSVLDKLPTSGAYLWKLYSKVIELCSSVETELSHFDVPLLKRQVLDLTDAGPGVGISNLAVIYRVVAEVLICKYDFYARVHLAPGDSSNNEVERVQSSIGDAICDGGALIWDHFPKYSDVSEQDVATWTVQQHEEYELERMERNAFAVCEEINSRVDGAATANGYMKSRVSKHREEFFFWDAEFLKEFIDNKSKSEINRTLTPGMNYYTFLYDFANTHIKKGEKVMEFVKNSCITDGGLPCLICAADPPRQPVMSIPQPYPLKGSRHYKHIKDTPSKINGVPRDVDDYNPRVQLNKMIQEGEIDDNSLDKIKDFCEEYIVDETLVLQYMKEAKSKLLLKAAKTKERKLKKQVDKEKRYCDYDWHHLVDSGLLKKEIVATLDKYILHHNLKHLSGLKKDQKVEGIKLHYFQYLYADKDKKDESPKLDLESTMEIQSENDMDVDIHQCVTEENGVYNDLEDSESGEENDSDEDEVIQTTRTEPVSDLIDESDDENDANWEDHTLFKRSRYGRYVGTTQMYYY